MKWADWVLEQAREGGERLGESVAYIFKKIGKTPPGDATADKAAAKLAALNAKYESDLAAILDEIPGVPTIGAVIIANAAKTATDALIAGAAEGYKAAN